MKRKIITTATIFSVVCLVSVNVFFATNSKALDTSFQSIFRIERAYADPGESTGEVSRKKFIAACEESYTLFGVVIWSQRCTYCAWTCGHVEGETISNCTEERSCAEALALL